MRAKELAIDYVDQVSNHEFHLPISVFKKPKNLKEYAKLQKILDQLIDEVRDNEKHLLLPAMQIIGENLEQYNDENHPAFSRSRFRCKQQRQNQKKGTHTNGAIREIKRSKMPTTQMKIHKGDDITQTHTIDKISNSTANNQTQR